jgi:hypothetical protein
MKTNIEPGGELSTHQLPDVAQSQYREVPLPDFYLVSATSEQKPIIARQSKEVATGRVVCFCGLDMKLTEAFRCLYCGIWFCNGCAESHFGKTIYQWTVEKRVSLRERIEARRAKR